MKNLPGTIPDKLQPHNVEAEEAVLGALLIDPDAIMQVATFLQPDDFYIIRNGWIYEAILALYDQHKPADLITVSDELDRQGRLTEAGGVAYLTDLLNSTPTSIHCEYYGHIVERCAGHRRLIDGAGAIARLGYDNGQDPRDVYDQAEKILFGITSRTTKTMPKPIAQPLGRVMDTIETITSTGVPVGLPTGLTDLDRLLGGLQKSDMIILGGRPGMGKTSLALSIAYHAAKSLGKRVCVFSLEMSDEQLVQRLVAAETGIDSHRLRLGDIKPEEWSVFYQGMETVSKLPVFIDDTPAVSAIELKSKARRLHAQTPLDLIVVDYLQLMRGDDKSENRQQEISYISRSVKALARELNVPILALSQLSRGVEGRSDKRPLLSDLRESGSLEQDADVVMFIYRDDMYNQDSELPNIAEIIVAKHRHGPTGTFSVYFKKSLTQFIGLEVRKTALGPVESGNGRKGKKVNEMKVMYQGD